MSSATEARKRQLYGRRNETPTLAGRGWALLNYAAIPLIGIWLALHLAPQAPLIDDMAYWGTRDGVLYEGTWNQAAAYVYSPAFAQVFGLVNWLPYGVFHVGLSVVQLAAVLWLLGPALTLAFCLTPFLGGSYIANGNITPLLAVCLVRGFHAPLVLTKILPGVTLLWFVGRRDWSGFAKALWILLGIVAVSFVLWPRAWFDWADALARAFTAPRLGWAIPLAVRLPLAGFVAWYAGRTNRRWLLPVAAMLSVGDIWWTALVWLSAVPRLHTIRAAVVILGVPVFSQSVGLPLHARYRMPPRTRAGLPSPATFVELSMWPHAVSPSGGDIEPHRQTPVGPAADDRAVR